MKIQRDTGVPRQIAKRAYEEWTRSQSREELKAARKDVAAEEFRNHLACLVKLAEALVNTLYVPGPSRDPISAEDVLRKLWESDIVGEYGVYGKPRVVLGANIYPPETCLRQNQILFESLQSHTHEKVDWQVLERWKRTWDECTRAQDVLRQEARRILLDTLNHNRELKGRIVNARKKRDAPERMINGVLYVVWEHILAGKTDQSPLIECVSRGKPETEVLFGEGRLSLSLIFAEADLAKQVKDTCIGVAKNLSMVRKEDMTELVADVRRMREMVDELTERLNPLMLRPQILHTRCDLCPA